MTRPFGRLALLSTLLAGPAETGQAPEQAIFDVYQAGVAVAELTVRTVAGESGYLIRKRDPQSGDWTAGRLALEGSLAGDTAFRLPGSLADIPARLASLDLVHWDGVEAVGWPDAGSIYVRAGQRSDTVLGRAVTATTWAERDGSRPVDFVIGDGDRLLAAIDPSNDGVMVRRGYEGLTTVAAWRDSLVSQPRFGYRALPQAMVPMADGVRLATLVYLPDGPGATGPFPVILVRTPYGIGGLIRGFWPYAARGYALVFQATRGTSYGDPDHRSEGIWEPMIHEPADGRAALEWVVAEPWSNDRICMEGGSYVGYTQWTASMAGNPALRCMVPESSMGTAFSDQPYMGGSLVEGMAYYMFFMLDRPILASRTWTEILHHRPLMDLDDFATGQPVPQWDSLLAHGTNDAYWRDQDWYRTDGAKDVATLQISGWFDDDFPGTESNWAYMEKIGTPPQRLVIGPWKHGYNVDRALNGYSFGTAAIRDDIRLLKQRWYDRFLKEVPNGVERPTVSYFMLGVNEWRTASRWPPPEAVPTRFYLHSRGGATRLPTLGSLTREAPAAPEPADTWRYDPRQPPPNWMSFEQMTRWEDVQTFPYDFKDIESRPDVAVYTSEPLTEDLAVAGTLQAVLYASTDVTDTDWWVHLADVDPSGRSNRITLGMLRARFRTLADPAHHIDGSNFEREVLLSGNPADVVKYEIWIRSIATVFRKGHRIRIAVMNAMDNYSFPNSNTGEDEARTTRTVVGTMTLHHGPDTPSHVVLPVLNP